MNTEKFANIEISKSADKLKKIDEEKKEQDHLSEYNDDF